MKKDRPMTIGARFELATRELCKEIFPLLGFEITGEFPRHSGSQDGFDICVKTRPVGVPDIKINFFIECKGASTISPLPLTEFECKPEQLNKSVFNPDYWILFSPLRYSSSDIQEVIEVYTSQYPFAFVNWTRAGRQEDVAGIYIDLFKHFPNAYDIFKEDVPDVIRDVPPQIPVDEIIKQLRNTLRHAYDEFYLRNNKRGIIPGVKRITPLSIHQSTEKNDTKLAKIRESYFKLNSLDMYI